MASSPNGPDKPSPAKTGDDGTRVDLGDDLLLAPAAAPASSSGRKPVAPSSPKDDLDSARILMAEGLLEDARKALFKVLKADPGNRLAHLMLDEIRASEVEALLHPEGRAVRRHTRQGTETMPSAAGTEAVLSRLEADWKLGISPTEAEIEVARRWVAAHLGLGSSAKERVDWAVGFLHSDLPELAAEVLEAVPAIESFPEVLALLSRACVLCGRNEEALSIAEQALRDPGFPRELREEMNYLRGSALMASGRLAEASAVFSALDDYRDSRLRLRSMRGAGRQ